MVGVVGWKDYSVTKDGRIWSHKSQTFMKAHPIRSGYLRIRLREPGRNKILLVHRIVAQAYIPNPHNKAEVHHINAIRNDNRVENLQWVTREQNNQAAWDCGNKKFKPSEAHTLAVKKNVLKAIAARKKGNLCNTTTF